ncbi:hypothetical protein GGU10DRAFT_380763 [Lentinula aff. detonsa]|uniref:Uncharacterized protein n=1 Tax=Lentinula aff. detonsa TaxID=2804958 RepID=A0AA38NIU0_9AGAR|nr:hypothetical protein GGU10DRAFT_380763 [Lentinula aff. detonsa]
MLTTLVTVTLFAVAAINGAAADLTISTPTMTTCEPVDITWSSTTGPYNLIMVSPNDPCGDALVDLGDQDGTSVSWTPNVAPGTQLELSLVDANDEEAWSGTITVAQGSDTSCVPADALAAASSSAAVESSSSVTTDASSSAVSSAVSSVSVAVTGTTLVITGSASTASASASASSSAGPLGAVGQDGPLEASSNGAMTFTSAPIMVLSAVAGILVLSL